MKQIIVLVAAAFGLSAFAYDADTLGFYSFKGGEPGVFSGTVANDIPEGVMNAAVVTAGNGGQTAISDERPGKYVYAGGSFVKSNVLCEDPLSLRLGKGKYSSTNKSGVLSFKDAGPNLSKCHAGSGYTYEFFFKMDEGDSSQAWGYQIAADLGYRVVADDKYCPIRIMVPYPDNANYYYFRASCKGYDAGPYQGDKIDVRGKVDGFTSFMDGRWHHFAQTETVANGVPTIKYYIDYALVYSQEFAASKIVAEETSTGTPYGNSLTVGKYVQLGYDNTWNAAVSCVRFTKRALSTSELLRASDREGFDDDFVAFYPFRDGAPSSSAVGTGTLHNEVAPDLFPGTVELSAGGTNPSATFDAEGPNTYVFCGKKARGKEPFVTNPGSVWLRSDSNGKSGTMFFSGLATGLSKCHATGSTVEFFVKFTDGKIASWDQFVWYYPGYLINGTVQDFRVYLPRASDEAWKKSLTYSLGSADSGRKYETKALPFCVLEDGKWHHLAIVETPSSETGVAATVSVWLDYVKYSSLKVDAVQENATVEGLRLCRGINHAKYACLKVTSRPLGKDEFLHATATLPAGMMLIVR